MIHKSMVPMLLIFGLSGCYKVWQDVETFAASISCSDSRNTIKSKAVNYLANIIDDEESKTLQIQKESDTVVIQFNKLESVERVSVFKTSVQFMGLHRKQLAPETILECPTAS